MGDEMDLTAAWANLAAEVPEHSRRDLPQLERIFYAGAAAVHDVLMLALTAHKDIAPADVPNTLEHLLARLTDIGEELREVKHSRPI